MTPPCTTRPETSRDPPILGLTGTGTEQALYPDWDRATAGLVAGFRESVGTDAEDPRFVQLVGELSLSSERFRRLWARHDVQLLVIYHAQPGTGSAEKLAILASLAAPAAPVTAEDQDRSGRSAH
jgi:hypothetical protein